MILDTLGNGDLQVGNLDNCFAKVTSVKHANEGIGSVLDALGNILLVDDLALDQPRSNITSKVGTALGGKVTDNEAADRNALADNMSQVADAIWSLSVVLRNHTTRNDTSVGVHDFECRLQGLTANVLVVTFFFFYQNVVGRVRTSIP